MTKICVTAEYNDRGYLVWANDYVGLATRGETLEQALVKLPSAVSNYAYWANNSTLPQLHRNDVVVVQEHHSTLNVQDADSDVLFSSERLPMDMTEYIRLKERCLRSAKDFQVLYDSIPQKGRALVKSRKTFYGKIPQSAQEMLQHTNQAIAYYASAFGIDHENVPDLLQNRIRLFSEIEAMPDYLSPRVFTAADGELWTRKKLLRRILFHDRIHARALYRRAITFWQKERIENPFYFS